MDHGNEGTNHDIVHERGDIVVKCLTKRLVSSPPRSSELRDDILIKEAFRQQAEVSAPS